MRTASFDAAIRQVTLGRSASGRYRAAVGTGRTRASHATHSAYPA